MLYLFLFYFVLDINECVDPALNNCNPLIEDCVNNFGSHVCNCKPGYARNDKGDCISMFHIK